jgi:6-phosphogluconolactonase
MSHGRMARRRVLALGLGGIAGVGLGAHSLIGGRKAMAQGTPETVVYVSNAGSKEVFVLSMNRATGALELIEKTPVPGTDKPSPASLPMATSPDKHFLYAQLRSEPYPVSTFAIDRTTGRLKHVAATPLVDQMAYINTDRTGRFLLGASYVGAKLAIYPINPQNVVEAKATQILDTKPKAHCVVIDAGNKNVYVPVLGGDIVLELKFDPATGTVSPNGPGEVATKPGAGPRHLTFHPNGKFAYLITETTATIGTYAVDPATGLLKELQFVDTNEYKEAARRLGHPCHAGRQVPLRRRAQDQHADRLQDRPGQGNADSDRPLPDREDAARFRDRPAWQVPALGRHGFGRDDGLRNRPGERRAEADRPLRDGDAAELDRDRRSDVALLQTNKD